MSLLLASWVLLAGLPSAGSSQTEKPGKSVTVPTSQPAHAPEDQAPRKSIRMDEIEIQGEFEKPKAMFVIPMAPVEYRRGTYQKDFTAEILAPIDREALENLKRTHPSEGRPQEP